MGSRFIHLIRTDSNARKIESGNLLYGAGSSNSVLCDYLEGWDGGREVQEGGDICIPMADSC